MKRMLSMALVVIGALACNVVLALGLGGLKLNSALNEKLDAEITITNIGDLSKNQLLPNLASHEDFARAGVERIFFLTSIQFDVTILGNGNALLKLTTDKIVLEPYLNFLVEIHWPSGRLLREYTVLLDPPVYANAPAPVIRQSTLTAQPSTEYRQPVTTQKTRRDASARVSSAGRTRSTVSTGEGADVRVKKNDTLWGIAKDHRPSDNVSIRQTMVTIQRHNPNAFINNNINLLKAGEVLRLPNEADVLKVSYEQALSETQRQNQEWQEKRKTIDATPVEEDSKTQPADQAVANSSEQVQLKLVSDEEAKASKDLASMASGGPLAGDAPSQEGATGSTAEQTDPASGNTSVADSVMESPAVTEDLQQQIEDLKRLVDLKDQQLALLQSGTGQVEAASTEPVPSVDSMVKETKTIASEHPMEDNNINNVMNVISKVTDNPLYIAIFILAILVVLMLIAASSRKRKQAEEYPAELRNTLDARDKDVTFNEFVEDEKTEIADDSDTAREPASQLEPTVSSANEIDDILDVEEDQIQKIKEEADIYIAYGRYERAVEVLQPAINDNPQNTELRLKLAEIFVANNNQSGLSQLEADLQAIGDEEVLDKFERMIQQQKADAEDAVSMDVIDDVIEDEVQDEDKNEEEEKDLGMIDFELPSDIDEEKTAQKKSEQSGEPATDVDEKDALEDEDVELSEIDEDEFEIIEEDLAEKDTDKAGTADSDDDVDDMDFLGDTDESATKIELAKAYIDMNDQEAALDLLNEVVEEGSDAQKEEARKLLDEIS